MSPIWTTELHILSQSGITQHGNKSWVLVKVSSNQVLILESFLKEIGKTRNLILIGLHKLQVFIVIIMSQGLLSYSSSKPKWRHSSLDPSLSSCLNWVSYRIDRWMVFGFLFLLFSSYLCIIIIKGGELRKLKHFYDNSFPEKQSSRLGWVFEIHITLIVFYFATLFISGRSKSHHLVLHRYYY